MSQTVIRQEARDGLGDVATLTAEVAQLADEKALEGIQEEIAYAAQDEWLINQFETRTPFPRRESVQIVHSSNAKTQIVVNKNGHPYLFKSTDLSAVKEILNGSRNFSEDLYRIKMIFVKSFGEDPGYFSYLDSLSEEDFYSWLEIVSTDIYKNNSHWAKFAADLLIRNSIDPSDLVEGKLDSQSLEKLMKIQKALRRLQQLTDGSELRSAIIELQGLGITPVMMKAHEEWRMTFYQIAEPIRTSEADYNLEALEYQYILGINNLIGTFAKDPNLTVDEMMERVKAFRRSIEENPKVTANQTFGIIVSLAKVTDFAQKYSKGLSQDHLDRLKELEARLTKIVSLDANPAPIDTVVKMHNEAVQRRGHEA